MPEEKSAGNGGQSLEALLYLFNSKEEIKSEIVDSLNSATKALKEKLWFGEAYEECCETLLAAQNSILLSGKLGAALRSFGSLTKKDVDEFFDKSTLVYPKETKEMLYYLVDTGLWADSTQKVRVKISEILKKLLSGMALQIHSLIRFDDKMHYITKNFDKFDLNRVCSELEYMESHFYDINTYKQYDWSWYTNYQVRAEIVNMLNDYISRSNYLRKYLQRYDTVNIEMKNYFHVIDRETRNISRNDYWDPEEIKDLEDCCDQYPLELENAAPKELAYLPYNNCFSALLDAISIYCSNGLDIIQKSGSDSDSVLLYPSRIISHFSKTGVGTWDPFISGTNYEFILECIHVECFEIPSTVEAKLKAAGMYDNWKP